MQKFTVSYLQLRLNNRNNKMNVIKSSFDSFINFTKKIEGQKHISHGNGTHMRQKLYALKGSSTIQRDFFTWLDTAKKQGHFTPGNVDAIKTKFIKVFSNNNQPIKQKSQAKQLRNLANTKKVIWFYDHKNKLTEIFGNFYMSPVTYKGITYSCSEAAFQAQKCLSDRNKKKFVNLTGDQAFRKARKLKALPRKWNVNKFQIMKEIVTAKFQQNPQLKKLLLATNGAELVEHNPVTGRDKIWSDNHDGSGQNHLGKTLMKVRQTLGGTGVVNFPNQYNQYVKNK